MDALRPFFGLIWLTLVNPAMMARKIMLRNYDRGTLWMGLALVDVLSVVLVLLLGLLVPVNLPLGFSPMLYGLIMTCILVVSTMALYLMGLLLGGASTFPHTFAAVIWLEMTAICVRTVQAIVSFISPSAAGLISTMGLVALLWVLVNFVNETQRFNSLPRALATIVFAFLGAAVGLAFYLALIGASAQLEI
jgi:hypothetical protein